MSNLAQYDLIIIVIAVLIGLIVAYWAFRGRGGKSDGQSQTGQDYSAAPAPPRRTEIQDGPEGNAVPDEFAAAAKDVAGEILGVDAHPSSAGPAGPADNLQMLKGVGPKLASQLNENGITRFDQLARLGANETQMLDDRMGAFRGRIARDRLVEQADYLARGDIEGFEAKFGRLGS